MSYSINLTALLDRAAKRAASPATPATRLPDSPPGQGSQVAGVATNARQLARGNPLMTAEQGSACHARGWSDAEIQAFTARRDRLLRWGNSAQEADYLAERLTLRDREADDRRVCGECGHGRSTRCPDGGPLPATVLHRCPTFNPGLVAELNQRGHS